MANYTDRVLRLLAIVSEKVQLPSYLDFSVQETDEDCPKCGTGRIICIHGHKEGDGPSSKRPYDYDQFVHVCNAPLCDYKTEELEDTPKDDQAYPRPTECLICKRDLEDSERVHNRSQV